jgi:branched-chain amino acid transport system ATP-binding protein
MLKVRLRNRPVPRSDRADLLDGTGLVLELRGVCAGYNSSNVLSDVSLRVPKARVVVVLGPNGAGKTTLLRSASGHLRISSGELIFDGVPAHDRSADALARLGICHIPEGRGVFPSMTVRENIRLFALRGHEREATERATTAFPALGSRLSQIAGSLSGGEQQMLALVRAYVTDPRVVMVDEASMGLAPLVVDQVFEFLETLRRQGTSLVVVEQYVERALAIADVVYILNRGRVGFSGSPQEARGQDLYKEYLAIE